MTSSRRASVDWARGLAVLLMIEAHTFDAWVSAADRSTMAFRDATILGGFAAPLFLWLAGLSIPLAASRAAARGSSRYGAAESVCRRGLEIFVLAFLFRLQAFIVSPGNPLVAIFKVDILNVMGPAIAVAAIAWALRLSSIGLVAVYAAAAAGVAMATPVVRMAGAIDALPIWIQWYARPSGEHTTFTLFPWAGFVFAGAAVGVIVDRAGRARRDTPAFRAIGAAGAAIVAIGFVASTRPSIYARSEFWTSSPAYFAIRVGVMMTTLALLFELERILLRSRLIAHELWMTWLRPLETFGRHSLFVYWIHVELVYGYASWLWKRQMPMWGAVLAYAAFTALMYWTIPLKNVVQGWGRVRRVPATPEAVAA